MTPQPEPIASYQATARPRQEGCKHDCPGGTRAGSEHTLATAGPVRRDTDLGSCCPRSRTAGLADIDLADITAAQNLTVRSGADLDRLENLVMTVARPQGATLTCGLEAARQLSADGPDLAVRSRPPPRNDSTNAGLVASSAGVPSIRSSPPPMT